MKKLKILYQINSLETVYAARFIYEGYKFAFIDKGYEFIPFTSSHNLKKTLKEYDPDIFITSLNHYNLKFIDLDLLKKYRDKGLVMFTQIAPWKKLPEQPEGIELESNSYFIKIIKNGLAGDVFFHWIEKDDPCMDGFEKETGKTFHTIILAANTNLFYPEYDEKYKADISFVGSFLPAKRNYMKKHLFPLRNRYKVKLYGSDWTPKDRFLGNIQKAGQYFNIDALKDIRGIKLPLDDERKVYSSSLVSLNLHEEHQRAYGSDFNERTFKIIASGGFQISDKVSALRRYFNEDELVIAENTKDWFEKIDYYVNNPDERIPIIKKGRKKVLKNHTYHNRVDQIVSIYNEFVSKNG